MFFPHPLGYVYEVTWKSDHFFNSRHKWVEFQLTRPTNNWLEDIVLDGIHPFLKLELDDRIILSYGMNGPFPQPEGEVDIFIGECWFVEVAKKETCFPEEIFCFTVHSLWLRTMWKSTSKNFNRSQEYGHPP